MNTLSFRMVTDGEYMTTLNNGLVIYITYHNFDQPEKWSIYLPEIDDRVLVDLGYRLAFASRKGAFEYVRGLAAANLLDYDTLINHTCEDEPMHVVDYAKQHNEFFNL